MQSWKGIPYAAPPLGDLRFKAPIALKAKPNVTLDVSDDALRCVQFTDSAANIVGVKAGPGQEDCLKLWIWKPASDQEGDKLPVMVYIHGGGLQFSSAPNNDFSDWVSQEQNFIAINLAYRLGAFGFMASEDLLEEGQWANAGLLDMRMGFEWVQNHVEKIGGDPSRVTIMGQSGGGLAVVSQLALFDGKAPFNNENGSTLPFHQAIARSIQRSPTFTVQGHAARNARLAQILNCSDTSSGSQIACFRNVSASDFVAATNTLSKENDADGLSYGGFLPTIDGHTLTDTVTHVFQKGRFAKLSYIGGLVSHEAGTTVSKNVTELTVASIGAYNLSNASIATVFSMYRDTVNSSWGEPYDTGNFFIDVFRSALAIRTSFGEGGISGSERLTNKAMCDFSDCTKTWGFRFAAPTVGTNSKYPLNYVVHSADNSYLQNATAVMTDFEEKIAREWRAYIGSFIRTGDPNREKLPSAVTWPSYGTLGHDISPIRLVPTFGFSFNPDIFNSSASVNVTGTEVEVVPRPQRERVDWWLSDEILGETRL